MLLLIAALLAPHHLTPHHLTVQHVRGGEWRLHNKGARDLVLQGGRTLVAHAPDGHWPLRRILRCGRYNTSTAEAGGTVAFHTADLDRLPPGRYSISLDARPADPTVLGTVIEITIDLRRRPIAVDELLEVLDAADEQGCAEAGRTVGAFFVTEATQAEVQRVGRHLARRDGQLWRGFVESTLARTTWLSDWSPAFDALDEGRRAILRDVLRERLRAATRSDVDLEWFASHAATIDAAAEALTGRTPRRRPARPTPPKSDAPACARLTRTLAPLLTVERRTRKMKVAVRD